MTELEAPRAIPRRVLVALFFWRSLELEGGAGLVAGIARELERRALDVNLLLPTSAGWMGRARPVRTYLAPGKVATLRGYRAQLSALAPQFDRLILLENNLLSHLILAGRAPSLSRSHVHLSSPTVGPEIFRAGVRRQFIAHFLGKSRVLARALARMYGFRAGRYVVSTRFQRAELVRIGCPEERIEVVPFGVDPERFQPGPERGAFSGRLIVGFLGHFSPIKGVPDLLDAFALALKDCPEMRLRLAWSGKGSEAGRVLERIRSPELAGRVELLGRVEVPAFLDGVDALTLPYRSSSLPHLPLVLLEALAMGVPVVTTRVGGLQDAIVDERTGFTVDPGDREAMARCLVRLSREPELRSMMRKRILADCPRAFNTGRFCDAMLAGSSPTGGGS